MTELANALFINFLFLSFLSKAAFTYKELIFPLYEIVGSMLKKILNLRKKQ